MDTDEGTETNSLPSDNLNKCPKNSEIIGA